MLQISAVRKAAPAGENAHPSAAKHFVVHAALAISQFKAYFLAHPKTSQRTSLLFPARSQYRLKPYSVSHPDKRLFAP